MKHKFKSLITRQLDLFLSECRSYGISEGYINDFILYCNDPRSKHSNFMEEFQKEYFSAFEKHIGYCVDMSESDIWLYRSVDLMLTSVRLRIDAFVDNNELNKMKLKDWALYEYLMNKVFLTKT